jgi:hypothetical protein
MADLCELIKEIPPTILPTLHLVVVGQITIVVK